MATPYTGGASNRFFADWAAELTDPNDDYWHDGATLAARSWDLWRNDPYFRAMIETMIELTIGPDGLMPKSQYQEDSAPETDEAEQQIRDQIDAGLRRALNHTRLDASGVLSYAEMSEAIMRGAKVAGTGYAVRVWRPNRPDTYQGTAWRVIDPARVSNPSYGADTPTMFQGHELNADGREVAIHVQRSHPNIQRVAPSSDWQRIPIYDSNGQRNVTIRRNGGRPEQIRTLGCGAPVLLYLRMLQSTTESWAIAKRIQAAYALMIKTDDPAAAARADRFGSVLGGNVPIRPGQRYYHNHQSVEPLNWQFQGNDYEAYRNPIIEAVCACEGVPYEMVLKRLTKSNMASSRAALMTAYQFGKREANRQIQSVEYHWASSIVREDIARERVTPRTDDMDEVLRFKWRRPPRPWPDPQREAAAVREWVAMGHSYSSAYEEVGKDFEDEVRQRARDQRLLDAQGVVVGITAAPAAPAQPQDPPPSDDDENDDETDDKEEEGDMKPSEMRAMLSEFATHLRPAAQPLTVVNEQRIAMDENSARVMGDQLARAMSAAQPPTVNVAAPVVNMQAAPAPVVNLNVEPSPVHVQAAAAPEPVAPVVNVNLPAPIVENNVRVEVPARKVIAKPGPDGTVEMTPVEG